MAGQMCPFFAILVLGLVCFTTHCQARAVNVSNSWTMPQEGLNVFYRFFRDRISWFEADAVCQFHHANLVTVDNSFQFDATRDLLRELDVNDIVWIGLMRPQSSERFMWSNSRPLVTDTGYWAESLPLMDAPLCAVIDPIRDYRWHALRCGGPETASFLCEMPVPSWADTCILKDMPNLTMQYMADTASIELIRNCAEEGLLRQSCKGKQDRERAIRELICPRERLEAQRINDITNSHFKSLQIINSVRTDNNENNDIDLMPMARAYDPNADFFDQLPTEKNTVQRLIEQFNVDELMQGDEPQLASDFQIPGQIPMPVKKAAKKVVTLSLPRKTKWGSTYQPSSPVQGKRKPQLVSLDDMMMGDQAPAQGEPEVEDHPLGTDASNEILVPLPHKKKILPQDLKTMPTITEAAATAHLSPETTVLTTTDESSTSEATFAPTTAPTTIITTPEGGETTASSTTAGSSTSIATPAARQEVGHAHVSSEPATVTVDGEEASTPSIMTSPPATIGHPMHPQQPRSNIITEETQHPHIKESAESAHFIPPMLLVKSHYVPPLKHEQHDHQHHNQHAEHHSHSTLEEAAMHAAATTSAPNVEETTVTASSSSSLPARSVLMDAAIAAVTIRHDADPSSTPALTQTTSEPAAAAAGITDSTTTTIAAVSSPMAAMPAETTAAKGSAATGIEPNEMIATTTEAAAMTLAAQTHDFSELSKSEMAKEKRTAGLRVVNKTEAAPPKQEDAVPLKAATTVSSVSGSGSGSAIATEKLASIIENEEGADREAQVSVSSGITGGESRADKEVHSAQQEATEGATAAPDATTAKPAPIRTIAVTASAATTSGKTTETASDTAVTSDAAVSTPHSPPPASIRELSSTTAAPTTTTTAATATATARTTKTTATQQSTTTAGHDFLKETTEVPYKPNRRRSLTKPETASYFKKLLG